jgi:hypothetical protein
MRLLAVLLSFVSHLLGFALPGAAPGAQHFSINVDGREVTGCADLHVTSDDEIARADETITMPVGAPVKLTAARNGGVWIVGSQAAQIEVEACKIGVGSNPSRAQEAVAGVKVQQQADTISATGAAGSKWHVYFIVRAPNGASVAAESTNGPISLREADGTFSMQASNGPISISGSRGTINAQTQNGPISVKGSAGELTLRASNGPLSIKLDGVEWDGSGLTGETRNGPLSLTVPEGYRSGVLVEADGTSPMRCSGCATARKTWDDDQRRIELGGGPQIIKLTTSNGPVSVVQR